MLAITDSSRWTCATPPPISGWRGGSRGCLPRGARVRAAHASIGEPKNIQLEVSCAGVAVVGRILPQEETRVTRAEHCISKRLTARRDAARKEREKAYVTHLRLQIFGFIAEVINILLVRRDCRISPQHGRADN